MKRRYSLGAGRFFAAVGFAVMCLAAADRGRVARGAEPQWRYVVPKVGDPMDHPPLRALALSEKKPPDLKESVHYRGNERRYGEFRFGAAGSTLVTVVLDRVPAGPTDLYVDRNRNRAIEEDERLAGPGPEHRVPLDVEIPQRGRTERFPRTVVFRLGRAGRSVNYATDGYVEGSLRWEGREVPIRRVDANGDGGMADSADILWVNWKRDGDWNPFTDRLPMTPILQAENRRYVVRSDWLGERLSLEKLEGSGELQLSLTKGTSKSDFLEINLVLMGQDGSIAKLDLGRDTIELPVGEYSLYELATVMKDPDGGEPWAFSFGRTFDWAGIAASRGYSVKAKGRVPTRPLDDMTLQAEVGGNKFQYRPGDTIVVQPRLETADHLTLRACNRSDKIDSSTRHPGAEIRLTTLSGTTLDSATSGFA